MKYTDAHCHILDSLTEYSAIGGRIVNATCESEWDKIAKISDAKRGVFGAIGIHPWQVESAGIDWDKRLMGVLKNNPSLMVGEIGLDKFKPNINRQQEIFIRQFEIAAEFKRVVHLHCVGAWERILYVFKTHFGVLPPAIIAHGFNGGADIVRAIAEKYNVFFSFSAKNLETNNEKIRNRIRAVPLDRLLVESDADNLVDEVSNIVGVVEKVAKIIGQGKDEIYAQVYKNFQRVMRYVG